MSDWVYDWLADLAVPALSGIGGIVVGVGAVVVAYRSHGVAERSHGLAEQVRADEQKREADASRERYRDQIFRTVEPAVSALLDLRGELMARPEIGTPAERNLGSNVTARLSVISSIASRDDKRVLLAAARAFIDARRTKRPDVLRRVAGQLALLLPKLLRDGHSVVELEKQAAAMVQEALTELGPAPSLVEDTDPEETG